MLGIGVEIDALGAADRLPVRALALPAAAGGAGWANVTAAAAVLFVVREIDATR
jgi:hypothetical protein